MVTVAAWIQIMGVVLALAGGFLLWGPWSLLVGGAILVIVPEIATARRPRR